MRDRDLIVFAGALYDSPLWTNRQHVTSRLGKRGWRVLYVEPRLFLPRLLCGRFPGTRGRWFWLRRLFVPWRAERNLSVIAQANIIPKSREIAWVAGFNHALNAWRVRAAAWLAGFQDPVVLIYDTESAQYLDAFPSSRVVYDCVDDHRAQAGVDRNPARVAAEEKRIAERADAIAVTAEPLQARFQAIHDHVHLVPNAADVRAFLATPGPEPADIAAIPHPRIGTVGALDAYKIDVTLLAEVARKKPEWQFVLVGPLDSVDSRQQTGDLGVDAVGSLRTLQNVHFLGPKPKDQVPAYVHAFDVAMIPYRESAYNAASFPLKFWEFMASGKPVVAAGLPSLQSYGELVTLAAGVAAFIAGVERALREPASARARRVAEAKLHDWRTRVDSLERLLRESA